MAPKGKIDPLVCTLCGFETKRSGKFDEHCLSEHGMSTEDVWCRAHGPRPTCRCGCGATTRWNGWRFGYSTFVNGHNGNVVASYSAEEAAEISRKRSESLKGRASWAKGLTKETDERIRNRANATAMGMRRGFEEGRLGAWNDGHTKETDPRVDAMAESLKESYSLGTAVPWAKGLTKETDPRVAAMGSRVSITLQQNHLRQHLTRLQRLPVEEIKDRVSANGMLRVANDQPNHTDDRTPNIIMECGTCGERSFGSLRRLQRGRCFRCSPGGHAAQHQVYSFLRTLDPVVEQNVRSVVKLELDVFSRSRGLAIEYNGLYWHSELNKSKSYHQNKTEICAASGIRLFHVFEDEWRDKRPIVESMLRHRMGMSRTRVDARKCTVDRLDSRGRREFFDRCHIDSDTQSSECFCLVDINGRVVAAMSLRRPFHKTYDRYLEVGRYCTDLDTHVRGGLGKLTSVCLRYARELSMESLVTYLDTRHGGHDSYAHCGYTLRSQTPPRFWWTDFNDRVNRFKHRADKRNGLSEAEVAEREGVVRIWGCKNAVFVRTV